MRGVFLWVILILCAPTAWAAAAPGMTDATQKPRTVLVYGDSLSAGYGLPQDKAWVTLLAARIKQQRLDYTVANASISGETALGGLKRIDAALKQHQPAVVVLALGANDGLRGQSVAALRSNLEAIVEACRQAKSQVVLIGMRLPPNYGSDYAGKFHTAFSDIAKRHQLPLVPFLLDGFGENPEWFQADGIHPAVRAQPVMLDTVWKTLQPVLQSDNKKPFKIN